MGNRSSSVLDGNDHLCGRWNRADTSNQSAAICAAVGISGGAVLAGLADGSVTMEVWNGLALAGGAATAGCCAHMLGFAILSFPDNGVGGIVAQGLELPCSRFRTL